MTVYNIHLHILSFQGIKCNALVCLSFFLESIACLLLIAGLSCDPSGSLALTPLLLIC